MEISQIKKTAALRLKGNTFNLVCTFLLCDAFAVISAAVIVFLFASDIINFSHRTAAAIIIASAAVVSILVYGFTCFYRKEVLTGALQMRKRKKAEFKYLFTCVRVSKQNAKKAAAITLGFLPWLILPALAVAGAANLTAKISISILRGVIATVSCLLICIILEYIIVRLTACLYVLQHEANVAEEAEANEEQNKNI